MLGLGKTLIWLSWLRCCVSGENMIGMKMLAVTNVGGQRWTIRRTIIIHFSGQTSWLETTHCPLPLSADNNINTVVTVRAGGAGGLGCNSTFIILWNVRGATISLAVTFSLVESYCLLSRLCPVIFVEIYNSTLYGAPWWQISSHHIHALNTKALHLWPT